MVTEDIAIAHKDYAVRGGGERLVEQLGRVFDAPIFIGDKRSDIDLEYPDTRLVDRTRKQAWAINKGGLLRVLGYMAIWQNESRLTEYDAIITSGNEPLWYVPEPEQTLIAYCHSPPRPLYDLNHGTGKGALGALLRAGKRTLFQHNVGRPDLWIANSENVARRLNLYFNIPYDDIRVVYPPIDTANLHPRIDTTQEYYLCLGRLAHHKRTEFAIEACNWLDAPLKIAGEGPEEPELRAQAGETVEFLGYVSEERKRQLLAGAKALLMPAEKEDFGMVPVEALVSGTPVIGVDEGMTGEQIVDGKNGLIVDSGIGGFIRGIQRFEKEGVGWDQYQIRQWATDRFGVNKFNAGMKTAVQEAIAEAKISPEMRVQTDD